MKTQNNNTIKGIILLAVGILLLMINYNVFDINYYPEFFRRNFWIFLVGGLLLFKRKTFATGMAFLIIGTLFFLGHTGVIASIGWGSIWPLFIIAAGVNIMIARQRRPSNSNSFNQ